MNTLLTSPENGNLMIVSLLTILFIGIYFLPTFICSHKSFGFQVFLLNLLLGWTFLGWVIALIWSVKKETN